MKFKFIYILSLVIFAYLVLSSRSAGPANVGIGGYTGAPSEGTCANCHSGGVAPTVLIQLLDAGNPVTSYTAGQTYTLQVAVSGATGYGAQAVVLNGANTNIGTLSAPSAGARISNAGGRTYLEHSSRSLAGIFTATWVAPASGTGSVTIYAAGLNANGNGGVSGDGTTAVQLAITETVLTTINYANNSYCANVANPSPNIAGSTGGTFSSTVGLIFVSNSTGQINLAASTVGIYTVTYTYNAGANSTTDIVTITAQDMASFSYASASYCQNGSNPSPTLSSPNGGTFSASPAGLFFVNNSTGQINLSASTVGTYSVRFVSGGTCPTTVTNNISITAANSSGFNFSINSFCAGVTPNPIPTITGSTGGAFAAAAGLSINSSTGELNLGTSTAGTYAVSYTSPAPCATTSVNNITITARPTATISYPTATICQNQSSVSVNLTGTTGGTFSALASLDIDASSGTINPNNSLQGTYTINYNVGSCGLISSTTVQILPNDAATVSYASASYCQSQPNPSPSVAGTAGGTFAATPSGLIINSSTGNIDLAASTLGTYEVVYTTNGVCAAADTNTINILANGNAFFGYGMDTICQNQADSIIPVVTGIGGGAFSSNNANLVLNPNSGAIDISQSLIGDYEIIYTVGGVCPAADTVALTILEADTTNYFDFPDTVLNWCRDFGYTIYLNSNFSQLGNFSLRDSIINCSVWTLDTSLLSQNILYIFVTYFNPDSCYFLDRIPDTNMIYFTPNTNVLCPNIDSMILRFAYCESIDKLTLSNYQLFPNPAQNTVAIQNRDYMGDMRMVFRNSLGQVVEIRDIDFSGRADIEISHLRTGLYWVEIQQADGRRGSYRLIKE